MDFSAWSPMNAKRLIAPILILSISVLLSGCATKHPPKPSVTEEYKLGTETATTPQLTTPLE